MDRLAALNVLAGPGSLPQLTRPGAESACCSPANSLQDIASSRQLGHLETRPAAALRTDQRTDHKDPRWRRSTPPPRHRGTTGSHHSDDFPIVRLSGWIRVNCTDSACNIGKNQRSQTSALRERTKTSIQVDGRTFSTTRIQSHRRSCKKLTYTLCLLMPQVSIVKTNKLIPYNSSTPERAPNPIPDHLCT